MLRLMLDVRETLPTSEPRIVDDFPKLSTVKTPIYLGAFSWAACLEKWRIIPAHYVTEVDRFKLTPADIARDYIRAKYPKKHKINTRQYQSTVAVHRAAPLYCVPCEIENAVYLDLKSAYWSILQVIGWDVDYSPFRFLGVNSTCQDFPFWKNKLARNCIVSVGLTGWGKKWTGEKLEFHRKSNPFVNLVLWSAVQDVLHSIAADMVDAGAVYVHTDGYIFPTDAMQNGLNVLASWGLVSHVRHVGNCRIFAVGTYEIGEHKIKTSLHRQGKPFSNIDGQYRVWLKPKFYHFAQKTRLILA